MHFLEKTMENVRKHRDINLVTTEARRNYLASEPNYYIKKFFENLLAIEMKKTQMLMNKLAYLGLSRLEISKIVMYGFWNNYAKQKYGVKRELCYVDTDSFIVYIKTFT